MTLTHAPARLVLTALTSAALLAAPVAVLASAQAASASTSTSAVSTQQAQRPDTHRVVHRDARRDVQRFDTETEKSRPAPRDRATDITRTVVDHRADRLVMKVDVRHLDRSGYRLLIAEILTSDGRRFEFNADYSISPIGSRISLMRSKSYREVRCPGATWSVDPSANQVTASIPNSCLGDPRWVKVGVAAVGAPRNLTFSWGDDSRTRGDISDEHLALGPKQHRA